MILFLSKYPYTEEQFRDGFFQRVVDIDTYFENDERIYLDVSLRKNMRKKARETQNSMKKVYTCNIFLHFFFIIKLFSNANFVYIHSLHNTLYSFLFIKWIKNKYVLDLHGVVPEELKFQNMKLKSKLFNLIECFIFDKIDICVAVTNRLATHYKNKYPVSKCKYIIYTIFPNNLVQSNLHESNSDDNLVHIIYSGNTQKWQNIDLMLSVIKRNLFPNYKYTILTGELQNMKDALIIHGLNNEKNIELKSVSPKELASYYERANYGFILRDDIAVNNVACPTKLVEYMFYGIIPIVYSDNIGDFRELKYERIHYTNLDDKLLNKKSFINHDIIQKLSRDNEFKLKEILMYNFN